MDSTNTPALPYTDEERRDAWTALYERFGVIPVPTEQIWKTQADLTRALQALSEACKERDEARRLQDQNAKSCADIAERGHELYTDLQEARTLLANQAAEIATLRENLERLKDLTPEHFEED